MDITHKRHNVNVTRLACIATVLIAVTTNALPAQDETRSLPLVVLPASKASNAQDARFMAILMSGDGDYAAMVKGISTRIANAGVPVVVLKSRSYLTSGKRTPEGLAHDVDAIARQYMRTWGRDSVVLLGYSRGSDMAPFVFNRLPEDTRKHVSLIGMFGMGGAASFEFHLVDLVSEVKRATDIPVAPELEKLRGQNIFCVYGTEEKGTPCPTFEKGLLRAIARPGAHHFDGDAGALGDIVLDEMHKH